MVSELEFGLGRLEADNPLDQLFTIEERLLPPVPVRRTTKHWPLFIPPLNQGSEGTCVGHGWRHWLQSAPVIQSKKYPSAVQLYDWCTLVDEWPGNDLDRTSGTSVRSGGKVLKREGLISEYNSTRDIYVMADWIGGRDGQDNFIGGPLVWGSNWHEGMFVPDSEGFVHPTGRVSGGHCVCILGWDEKRGVFHFVNSWGKNWGPKKGRFMMSAEDVAYLLGSGGEAWTAQEIRL